MKLKVVVVFIFLLLFNSGIPLIKADAGKPSIQAFCRATLKDHTTVEGAIIIADGGYQESFDTNGFYFVEEGKYEFALLFNLDFNSIHFANRLFTENDVSREIQQLTPTTKVFYLSDNTTNKYYVSEKKITKQIRDIKGTKILQRTITKRAEYELLDYVPIYTTLPDILYLDGIEGVSTKKDRSIKPVKVKIENLLKFELLNTPPSDFVKQRRIKTDKWAGKYEAGDCVLNLDWYDELNKGSNKEYRNEIQSCFKKWEREYN